MTLSFGEILRRYRQNSKDPYSPKQLSQESFGDLLGQELGDGGYSGAAVSDWERGKSSIHPKDRRVLLSIIKVLYKQGGVTSVLEADGLLEVGNYRSLSLDEQTEIFPKQLHVEQKSYGKSKPATETNSLLFSGKRAKIGSAPPLPPLIIGRDDDLHKLKDNLGINGRAKTSIQILTAIKGWPGVGKTTIASALAHDPDVANKFPDGVLWTSLGQAPDILFKMGIWGRALGTDEILKAKSVEEARYFLANLLRDKQMLLIIDDVWKTEDAVPFNVGGVKCATLLTTRQDSIANALAPTANSIYRLKVLKDDDALELLRQLAPSAVQQYSKECLVLVKELEGLPLALQVAGRLLNSEENSGFGFNVVNLIDELRAGAKLLKADAPVDRIDLVTETTPTIAALLYKSIEILEDTSKDCFSRLGAFAPGLVTFDISAMKYAWEVEDPKPIITALVDRGLLQFVPELSSYQMHSLLVMLAKSLLTTAQKKEALLRHAEYYLELGWLSEQRYQQGHMHMVEGLRQFDNNVWPQLHHAYQSCLLYLEETGDKLFAVWMSNFSIKTFNELALRIPAAERIAIIKNGLTSACYLEDESAEASHFNILGLAYSETREFDKAVYCYKKALSIFRKLGDKFQIGQVLCNIGIICSKFDKPDLAITYQKQSLQIAYEVNNIQGQIAAYINLGAAYSALENESEAIDYYEKALAFAQDIGDKPAEISTCINLGVSYSTLGENGLWKAIEFYEQALVIAQELDYEIGKPNIYFHLGDVYVRLDYLYKAIGFYKKCIDIVQTISDIYLEFDVLGRLGVVYGLIEESHKSLECFDQQLLLARKIGDPQKEAVVHHHLGLACISLGEFNRAIESLTVAVDFYVSTKHPQAEEVIQLLDIAKSSLK